MRRNKTAEISPRYSLQQAPTVILLKAFAKWKPQITAKLLCGALSKILDLIAA